MNGALDNSLISIMAAAALIWLGFGCYIAFLTIKQRGLARRIRRLEQLGDEAE